MSNDYLPDLTRRGVRPLFLVFVNLPDQSGDGWRVCETDLEGYPVRTHSTHADLTAACNEANTQNQIATGRPFIDIPVSPTAPLSFAEMLMGHLLDRVNDVLNKNKKAL
jgi:hypothetical protein